MNWGWNCVEIFVNLVETGLFLFLINKKFPNKMQSSVPSFMVLITGTALLSLVGFGHVTWFPDFLVNPVILFIYAVFTRNGKPWLKLFWISIGIALISATAIISISAGLLLPGVTIDIIINGPSTTRFQLLIFSKVLQGIMFFPLANRKDILRLISLPAIVSLILISVTSEVTVALIFTYGIESFISLTSRLLLMGASIGVLVINILVFVLYESLSKQAEINLTMHAKLQQTEMLIKYNEEVAGLYEEMRRWRHDFHNHLQIIQGYIEIGKYYKVDEYIDQLGETVSQKHTFINSGNLTIDAILSSKMLLAQNNNIEFKTDIQIPPVCKIEDIDFCSLLGNLLDNAIESCQRISSHEASRYIDLAVWLAKGNICIEVKNSTNGAIQKQGDQYISSKKTAGHGIGIQRINEVTEKYNGYIKREHENNIFNTTIILPMGNASQLQKN